MTILTLVGVFRKDRFLTHMIVVCVHASVCMCMLLANGFSVTTMSASPSMVQSIDHLHASENILIAFLIAVTS